MATPTFESTEFMVAFCEDCAKEVLTHIQLDASGFEIRRCLHCDATVSAGFRSVAADELDAAGYAIIEARTCGNGGGCTSGGCGVRPKG